MTSSPMSPVNASLTSGGLLPPGDSNSDEYVGEYQSVDSEGVPVPQRMPSGQAMRSLLDECIDQDRVAADYRASIQGLVNGNKPLGSIVSVQLERSAS